MGGARRGDGGARQAGDRAPAADRLRLPRARAGARGGADRLGGEWGAGAGRSNPGGGGAAPSQAGSADGLGIGGAGAARDVAGGVAMGGAAAGGGRRSSGGGLRAVGSGGAPAAPLLQLPPVRARREQVRLATMFLHFDQPPFVHDGFILWHARSVQPIEDCRSPGVDGHSEQGGSDERAGEGPSAESEQQEQVRRV